jgi:hypothetical protein
MSVHIGRVTSYVELILDDSERSTAAPERAEAGIARQRAMLERIAAIEERTSAESFDD